MKRILTLAFLLSLFCLQLKAQWREQGYELYPQVNNIWVEALKVINDQTVWATLTPLGVYYGDVNSAPEVVRTTDGGATWQIFHVPQTQGHRAVGFSAIDGDQAWVSLRHPTVKAESRIMRTTDGGATWETILQDSSAGFQVHFFDELHGIAFRGSKNMKITSDGGISWHMPTSVPASSNNSIYYIGSEYYDAVGNTLWFPLQDGTILKSSDRGWNWTLQTTPVTNEAAISLLSFSDENNGMAAALFQNLSSSLNPSRLIRTTDGGTTWEEIPTSDLPVVADPRLFIRAIEAIPGAPGTYLMSIDNQSYPNTSYEIYITHDHGQNWSLYSDCPKSGYPIESFDFISPTVGWGGTGGAFSNEEPFFFKYTHEVYQPTVSFKIDLGGLPPAPQGVYLAMDADGWKPDAHPMTNTGGTVWETTLPFTSGQTVRYKFLNGNAWGQNESVPVGCGTLNDAGSFDREIILPEECRSRRLEALRFSSCLPNGELEPQTVTACDPNKYLICETFEEYSLGKLASQSDFWTTDGCDYDGTEGDPCDVDVTSYWAGFTNYSGGRAAHVSAAGQTAYLQLGGQTSGKYELAMKLYVPKGASGNFYMEIDTSYWTGLPYLYLSFNVDGTIFLTRDYAASETDAHFQHNRWMDVRLVFDLDQQKRELWLDGQQLVSIDDPYMLASLNYALFYGYGSFFGYPASDFFLDDITLEALVPGTARVAYLDSTISRPILQHQRVQPIAQKQSAACEDCASQTIVQRTQPILPVSSPEKTAELSLFPNPASGIVQVCYNLDGSSVATLQVVSMRGQVIQEKQLSETGKGIQMLDVRGLPSGVYFVRLFDGKMSVGKRLVVKG